MGKEQVSGGCVVGQPHCPVPGGGADGSQGQGIVLVQRQVHRGALQDHGPLLNWGHGWAPIGADKWGRDSVRCEVKWLAIGCIGVYAYRN